jgi:Na+-translocating ferredoxin:NAD+ oxidoreductase RnfG subunit
VKTDTKKSGVLGRLIRWVAFISLVGAYATGQFLEIDRGNNQILQNFAGYTPISTSWSPDAYRLEVVDSGEEQGYLLVKTVPGWGGPMRIATRIDGQQMVTQAKILSHKETPSFVSSMRGEGFFKQFPGKQITDQFIVGSDIDAVSGATISSQAVTEALRLAARDAGINHWGLELPEELKKTWNIGTPEIILALIYIGVWICVWRNFFKPRKLVTAFNIGFVGFYMGSCISIAHLGSLLLGYAPPPQSQLFWWLLVSGALVSIIMVGRNYYCHWVCPFGGIQEWITTTAGLRLKLPARFLKLAYYGLMIMLWLTLMVIFLTSNPATGMYEPFAALFSFKGGNVQWYLVSLTVFASFLIPRFWCRFFCPVGAFFRQLIRFRKRGLRVLSIKNFK